MQKRVYQIYFFHGFIETYLVAFKFFRIGKLATTRENPPTDSTLLKSFSGF